jgi:hypothetical protein
MAVTYRSGSSNQGSLDTIVLNKPAGVVAGDVLWAVIIANSAAITAPTGWVQQATGTTPTNAFLVSAFTRVVDGGANDGATYTFTCTGSTATDGIIDAYIGANNTTPMDVAATVATGAVATVTWPNISTVTNNAWHLASVGDTVSTTPPPAPTGYLGRAATTQSIRNSDKNIPNFTTVTGVTTTGGGDWVAISGALRPAAAATVVDEDGERIAPIQVLPRTMQSAPWFVIADDDFVPVAVTATDDEDGWWAGVQFGFVAVPRAAAVVSLALSVAISWAFNHNDEPVPQGSSEAVSFQTGTQRLQYSPGFIKWDQTEELPSAAAPSALEEGEWLSLASPPLASISQLWAAEDELPLAPDDSYWWRGEQVQTQDAKSASWADDELPVAQVSIVDEGDWALPVPLVLAAKWAPDWANDELPAVTLLTIEESDWQVFVPAALRPIIFTPDPGDDAVPAAVQVPSEVASYQAATQRAQSSTQFLKWDQPDELAVTPLTIDETEWQVEVPALLRPIVFTPAVGDDVVPPGPVIPAEVSFQAAPQRLQYSISFIKWDQPDEIPQGIDDGEWQEIHFIQDAISAPYWEHTDEVAITPTPGVYEEDSWQVYTPLPEPKRFLHLPDPDDPGPIALPEEEYWQPFAPQPVRAPTLFVADDEIVPQPQPLHVEDEYWWSPSFVPFVLVQRVPYDDEAWPSGIKPPSVIRFGRRFPPGLEFRPNLREPDVVPAETVHTAAVVARTAEPWMASFETGEPSAAFLRARATGDYAVEFAPPAQAGTVAFASAHARSWYDLRPESKPAVAIVVTGSTSKLEPLKPITDEEILAAMKLIR